MRVTSRGLKPQVPIRVIGAQKKHARGTVIRVDEAASRVFYRSYHNGGEYIAKLDRVKIDKRIYKAKAVSTWT